MKAKTAGIENEQPVIRKSRSKSGDCRKPIKPVTEVTSEFGVENFNYDVTSDDYNFMSYRVEEPVEKTDFAIKEPQLFKEVD
jgi:hypothetical protein